MKVPNSLSGWSASRLIRVALLSLAGLAGVPPVSAFGTEGHEVIALIAQQLLTPQARQRVVSILALEPGASLASISNWADQTRNRSTASWHYVNLPRGSDCAYVRARDCPDGNCVVEVLRAQSERLASPASSAQDQLEALKYVVHFVADVHQPLHAGYADDRGGNTYQLQAFGRGTNLHALWDTALIQAIEPSSMTLAATLAAGGFATASVDFAPEAWATESCLIVGRPDFYPARRIGDDYLRTYQPILMLRLQLAGRRLAAVLNSELGPAR